MKKKTLLKKAMRMATPPSAHKPGPFAAAADWAGEHLGEHLGGRFAPARHRAPAAGVSAAYGLGAAALAIPLGVWVGRRLRGGEGGDY